MQQRLKNDDTLAAQAIPFAQATPLHSANNVDTGPLPGTGPRQVLADRYELLGLVGTGGMGTVYRARDMELEEIVAVKLLRSELCGAPGVIERFRREVRLSRKVTHPNVARVFDIGEHEGDKFLTMEFIEGESLAALLSREKRLAVDRTLEIVEGVCAGLAAAHRAGVVHRDLKPDNVLLERNGRVVLTDFGIARALSQDPAGRTAGGMVGTPAYMAPEQVQGTADVDDRADIYALGAMLYEMLIGERAWPGDAVFAVASARLTAAPPDPRLKRPDIPDALARIVLRCMARLREERISGVALVLEELTSLTRPAPFVPQNMLLSSPTPLPAPRLDRGERSVAVLPFLNQGAPADGYLAAELTDDLIDTLSMTRGLKVRPRGLVARFREGDRDPRVIGRELDVQVVVDGSVRRRDGTVRISARLISVEDGFQLWAKRFDRPEAEVLRINDEAAEAIAQALTLDSGAPSRDAPRDPVAVDLLLRGRHEYRRFLPEHLESAIELYDQGLARAPHDPMLLSASALARTRLWFFTGKGGDLAEQAALRAVAAAPLLPEARLAMAAMRLQRMDVVGATRELKLALSRSGANAEAESLLAHILLECGAVDEGVAHIQTALSSDPLVPLAYPALSRAYTLIGRRDLAEDALRRLEAQNLSTSHLVLRRRYALWNREPDAALEMHKSLRPIVDMADDPLQEVLDCVVRGERPPPGALVQRTGIRKFGTPRRVAFVRQLQAELAGYFQLVDAAVVAVELAVDEGLFDILWLERCPSLDHVRADPRFTAIHAEVKRRVDAVLAAHREP